jgi:uncharacterized lipoprotein YddW (UPF0748 family)
MSLSAPARFLACACQSAPRIRLDRGFTGVCWRALKAVLGFVLLLWSGTNADSASESSVPAGGVIIEGCNYADDDAARAAWLPMTGSLPVSLAVTQGFRALKFECNFAEAKTERASWDRKARLDLGSCRGVGFQVLCRDSSPVSYFSIYFQSGGGWYHASFFPESGSGWNNVTLDKTAFSTEGTPAGWERITGIRLSAWRGKSVDTEFCLRDLRQIDVLGEDAFVAIIRADPVRGESFLLMRDAERFAEQLAGDLRSMNLGCVILNSREVTAARLRPAKLVILPPKAGLTEKILDEIDQYVKDGGRTLTPTNASLELRGAAPEQLQKRARALLAQVGELVPDLWETAARGSIAQVGQLSGYQGWGEAVLKITELSQSKPRVTDLLDSARASREEAMKYLSEKQYDQAMEKAGAASRQVLEAFCAAQQPAPEAFRAFWCHSAFGVEGIEWDEAIRRLAENGFSAILPNMLWGGAAFYESKVLPVVSQIHQRGDQIAKCLAACRKYGLRMHVWKVNWNLGSAAPKEFVDRMRSEKRLQADAQGKEEPWLCPSDPRNQKLEIDSMVEVVRKYDVDGIHFDYIRYPDGEHCFCTGCRARFERDASATLKNWPQEVLAGGALRSQWLRWRRANITAVVKAVSERARAIRPSVQISAAVFPNWERDRDTIGQDWKLWCEKGYLDFVCPMDYTPSNRSFKNMVEQQVQWAGTARCYPGIGFSASTSRFGPDRVIDQIKITRQFNTSGFTIFNYGVTESRDLLPLLGTGVTSKN